MKKILGILLVMVMMVTLFSLPVLAKPHANTDLMPLAADVLNLDFESATVGGNWRNNVVPAYATGFYCNSGGTAAVVAEDGTNKCLSVAGTASANRVRLYQNHPTAEAAATLGVPSDYTSENTALYGNYTTEFKFKLTALPASTIGLMYAYFNTSDAGTSPGTFISITSSGYFCVGTNTSSNDLANGQTILANRWYTVKVVNDFYTKTYDVYLNGVLIAADEAFGNGSDSFNSTYGTDYYTFNSVFVCDAQTDVLYLDDIRIFKEVTGRTTFAADDFSGNGAVLTYPFATGDSLDTTANFNADRWNPEFAGMQLDRRYARQSDVSVTSGEDNDRTAVSAGGVLRVVLAKNYSSPATDVADSLLGKSQLSVEFDFTPTAETTGVFYQLTDAQVIHHGWTLSATEGRMYAAVGKAGSVTADSYTETVLLGDYAMDGTQTYRIKISVDLTKEFSQAVSDAETLTKQGLADVYIDGKLVGRSLPFAYNCNTSPTAQTTNLGSPFVINGASTAAYYIDNLAVYTDVREKILSDAFDALGTKIAGQGVTLPTTTTEGYAVTWSTDDTDAVSILDNTATVTYGNTAQTVTLTAQVADTSAQHTVSGTVDVVVPAAYELEATYKDASDNVVSTPVAGAKLASVKLVDYNNTGVAADIFVAVYTDEGKKLDDVKAVDNALTADNTIDITLTSNTVLKLFAWASDGSLKPLMDLQTVVIE